MADNDGGGSTDNASTDNESFAEMEERLKNLQDSTAMELLYRNKSDKVGIVFCLLVLLSG